MSVKIHILNPEDVAPAKITFDDLVLDPGLPLETQAEWELKEDLFQACFPNGCVLDIGWYPEFNPDGEFGIALNQQTEGWEPFLRRRCRSIAELKAIVAEMVAIAKDRRSILQSLLNASSAWPAYALSDDLILDPLAPLDQQLDRLGENMFRAALGKYRIRIDWLPPHSAAGQFVISMCRAQSPYDFEAPCEPVTERHCRTTSEMLNAFKELVATARESNARNPD